jgi:hypothetical protein
MEDQNLMTAVTEQQTMQINPPFGYGAIVPVMKSHRVAASDEQVPQALRESNAIPVTISEIPRAARDYPIVFASTNQGQSYGVVALLGLRSNENLFVDASGKWREGVYLPAYLRRHPFCMATVSRDGKLSDERIVCVERAMLDEQNGLPLERQDGQKLSWWNERLHLLQEYEADLIRTTQICDVLKKFDLLRPFGAQAISADGEVMNLAGMYRVEEALLEKLKADELRMLVRKGIMGRLYAHMISLDNMGRLLDLQKQVLPQ